MLATRVCSSLKPSEAHIANRSRLRVTVKQKPGPTRYVGANVLTEVEAYMNELRAQLLQPEAAQLGESWMVRVRDPGHKPRSPPRREGRCPRFVALATDADLTALAVSKAMMSRGPAGLPSRRWERRGERRGERRWARHSAC